MSGVPVWALALCSICLSVAAQFLLKAGVAGAGVPLGPALVMRPQVVAGFALYGLGAMVWLGVLARWDVSRAYPLVGLGFVLAALVGWWLGESMTWLRIVGVVLVLAGVTLVGRS